MKYFMKIGLFSFCVLLMSSVFAEPAEITASVDQGLNASSIKVEKDTPSEDKSKDNEEEQKKKEALATEKNKEVVSNEQPKKEEEKSIAPKDAISKPSEIINTDKNKNVTVNEERSKGVEIAEHDYPRQKERLLLSRHRRDRTVTINDQTENTSDSENQAAAVAQEESKRAMRRQRHLQRMEEARKQVTVVTPKTKKEVTVVTPAPSRKTENLIVSSPSSFKDNVVNTTVVANRVEDQRFRERMIREQQRINDREIDLRKRELGIREREYRMREREMYDRELRRREWVDLRSRDQELRYLLWRERQLRRYYWRDNDRICYYYTYYKTGVRINRKVKICNWKNGVYVCTHPKRYFIYPVTKVICRRDW